jgi:hypothetical protein
MRAYQSLCFTSVHEGVLPGAATGPAPRPALPGAHGKQRYGIPNHCCHKLDRSAEEVTISSAVSFNGRHNLCANPETAAKLAVLNRKG